MPYPVTFEVDYIERRSRLTTFFRFILLIPITIFLWFYEIAAAIAILFAWFAIVITAQFPPFLFEFIAGFTRALARYTAYAALLCDRYPPFGGNDEPSYPVVITGRLPRGLFDVMVLANSYTARSDAYLFLLTESYPPFQDEQTRAAGLARD